MPAADENKYHLILANSARLLRDAEFLAGSGRYASAFFLAVASVEEIGKVLLDLWHTAHPLPKQKEWRSSHVRKQAAVGSLLLGAFAVNNFKQLFETEVSLTEELLSKVTKSFNESEEGQLIGHIKNGSLEATRQLAMYQDASETVAVPNADQFDEIRVSAVFEIAHRAMAHIDDKRTRSHARFFYQERFR